MYILAWKGGLLSFFLCPVPDYRSIISKGWLRIKKTLHLIANEIVKYMY